MEALFESADSTSPADLSAKLGIPPVYTVSYDSLKDDSGRVIQQVFFYGDEDKDGQHSYQDFLRLFLKKPEWKVTDKSDQGMDRDPVSKRETCTDFCQPAVIW